MKLFWFLLILTIAAAFGAGHFHDEGKEGMTGAFTFTSVLLLIASVFAVISTIAPFNQDK